MIDTSKLFNDPKPDVTPELSQEEQQAQEIATHYQELAELRRNITVKKSNLLHQVKAQAPTNDLFIQAVELLEIATKDKATCQSIIKEFKLNNDI